MNGTFGREVEAAIARLRSHTTEVIATIAYGDRTWPMWCVRSRHLDRNRPTFFISAGVHGDEPAGVHAALAFLSDAYRDIHDAVQFVVVPCLNPSGFDAGTLATASGANLNRLFGIDSHQQEVRALEAWLAAARVRFTMTFDLHEVRPDYVGEGFVEADNPRGVYLYETVTDNSERIGRAIIDELPRNRPVCDWPTVYGDINDSGVITYPEGNRNAIYAMGTSLDAWMAKHYAGHTFTFETPTGWPLDERVDTQLRMLTTAMRLAIFTAA